VGFVVGVIGPALARRLAKRPPTGNYAARLQAARWAGWIYSCLAVAGLVMMAAESS
jgi:hypothetical protein